MGSKGTGGLLSFNLQTRDQLSNTSMYIYVHRFKYQHVLVNLRPSKPVWHDFPRSLPSLFPLKSAVRIKNISKRETIIKQKEEKRIQYFLNTSTQKTPYLPLTRRVSHYLYVSEKWTFIFTLYFTRDFFQWRVYHTAQLWMWSSEYISEPQRHSILSKNW